VSLEARDRRRSRVAVAAGAFIAVIAGIIGGTLFGVSLKDYSDYTQHTTATVVDVQTNASSRSHARDGSTYTVHIDYEADGQTFSRVRMQGVITGTPTVGETVDLAYPPGRPADAVTAQTTLASTTQVLRWIGIGLVVLALIALVLIWRGVVRARRRRRAE